MFAGQPDQTPQNDTGDFAKFKDFMKRLVSVPHSQIQAELDREKRKKRKRASRASADKG